MSTKNLKDLREKRGNLLEQAKAINEKAIGEGRAMSAEETTQYDKLFGEAQGLADTIKRSEEHARIEKANADREDEQRQRGNSRERSNENTTEDEKRKAAEMRGFRNFLSIGERAAMDVPEYRALQQDVDASGGYLTVPLQFQNDLIVFLKDAVYIRQKATVFPVTTADSLGVPTLGAEPADADWTNEINIGGEDTTMSFGSRVLKPHPLGKLIKVSRKLLRIAAVSPESIIRDRFGYKFAVSEEKGFLTGSGANQPLGMFTASSAGISTARDIAAASQTAIGADDLISVKYGLKAQYRGRAEWYFHRDAVKQISKLKDGEGQYLWRAGLTGNDPDTVLGRPVNESEYCPNTFTTGKYVGLLGDVSYYHIADALTMDVQRLDELYAASNQVGFIMRKETDGMPVLEEAFARLKLA